MASAGGATSLRAMAAALNRCLEQLDVLTQARRARIVATADQPVIAAFAPEHVPEASAGKRLGH